MEWNEADAEDVLQTTYLKVVSGRATYAGRSTFKTWLFGVIRLTAHGQRRSARSHREKAELLHRERAGAGEPSVEPEDPAVLSELRRTLLEALAELPVKQREVLQTWSSTRT